MGRHTTPGGEAPAPRDDLIGWGAFSTVVAALLVGVLADWFEGFGVLVLGGLTTAALWFARAHGVNALGRGRHASDTPWSPSDLLELKDVEAAADPGRRETSGRRRPADDATRPRTGSGRRAAAPAAAPGDPLGWLPTDDTPEPDDEFSPAGDPVAAAMAATPPRSRRRARAVAAAAASDVDAQTAEDVLDLRAAERLDALAAQAGPGGAASGPADAVDGTEPVDPAGPHGPGAGRRSRRAVEQTGGPSRPVLPVAPFEMAAGGVAPVPVARPPLPGVVAGLPGAPAAPHAAPPAPAAARVAVPPVTRAPVRTTAPDPLAGPLDLDAVAAEPTVLDPALDPLWPAPVLELTQEQVLAPELRPAPVPAPAQTRAPGPVPARTPAPAASTPARERDLLPGSAALRDLAHVTHAGRQVRPVADRERAAEALDPLWARRARRPERPRTPGTPAPARTAAARREPAPLEPLPQLRPTGVPGLPQQVAAMPTTMPTTTPPTAPGVQPAQRSTAPAMPPQRTAGDRGAPVGYPAEHPAEPDVLVLPEPDVPDMLMLPETDLSLGPVGPAAAAGQAVEPPVAGDPTVPAARPAPGTLSLDELLVLHTRRPLGHRHAPDESAGRGPGG